MLQHFFLKKHSSDVQCSVLRVGSAAQQITLSEALLSDHKVYSNFLNSRNFLPLANDRRS